MILTIYHVSEEIGGNCVEVQSTPVSGRAGQPFLPELTMTEWRTFPRGVRVLARCVGLCRCTALGRG
jgi:hypothetical protein